MAALAAILLPSYLHAQITFQRTYGGVGPDAGYSVQQTTDSGYITSGVIGVNNWDAYLIRTDSDGETLWTRTFGGAYEDRGTSVCQTTDGGYVIGGATWSFGADSGDVYLIKTDTLGDTLWTRRYGGRSYDQGLSVQQTFDGGYIITGTTQSYGTGMEDVYLVKTNTSGDTTWTRTYGGSNYDYGRTVRQTTDGGFIIAGATNSFDVAYDFYLIKTGPDGNPLWSRTFGGDTNDLGYEVQQTTDSGYIVVGYTESFGAGRRDVYLVKTDANGETLWTRTFGGAQIDEGYSVKQTDDGGYVVVGVTKSFGAGSHDAYLIKTDANGETLWTRTLGGTAGDGANSVQQTADGGYIIAGATFSYGAGESDVWLVKTDSLGNVAVAEPKTSPTRTSALSLSCEPNPCRSSTVLHLTAGPLDHSTAAVRIHDSQGRLVHSSFGIRASSFRLDLRSMPAGAYFIRCDAAGEHAATRVVLQR